MRGEWRSEATWPPERLDGARAAARRRRAPTRSTSAATSAAPPGSPAPGGCPWGLPGDQRFDDALSLTYDWEPLDGRSRRDGPPACAAHRHLAGARSRTSRRGSATSSPTAPPPSRAAGILNLTHRDGHDAPVALEPGVPTEIEIELEATSWIFERGHRVRLSLAGADWPNIWPPPSGAPLAGRARERRARPAGARRAARCCPPPSLAADDRARTRTRPATDDRAAAGRLAVRGRPARARDARA